MMWDNCTNCTNGSAARCLTAPWVSRMTRQTDQEKFDRFTDLAARLLEVPVVSVSLVGPRHGVVTSSSGLPAPLVLLLAHRFSRRVAASRRPLVICDARTHPLGAHAPAVRDGMVIAYAGLPLFDARGRTLGTLSAMDTHPRAWTREQLERLYDVAWVLGRAVEWPTPTRLGSEPRKWRRAPPARSTRPSRG